MAEIASAIPSAKGDEKELVELAGVPAAGELPSTSPETSEALDKLLKETAPVAVEGDEPSEEEKAAEAKAAEEAAKVEADAKAAAAAKTEADAKAAAAAAAAESKPKDAFDAIELPPYTKPKAAEAFSRVKEMARTQEATALKTITELTTKVTELESKLKEGLPAETKAELEELRSFRAKLDVESDPKFKEWDAKVNENVEGIYAKLLATGVAKPELIESIKTMGGPSEVDWEKIADKLPAPVKRYIEGKLFENEDLLERKKKAVDAAKTNAQEYIKTRATESAGAVVARNKSVEKQVAELVPKLEWLSERKPTDKSTDEEKKSIESHNALMKEIKTSIVDAQADDSPEMRAILILGFAQLQKVRADRESDKATFAAEKTSLEAKLKEAEDLVARIKKSSTGRLRDSSAPDPNGNTEKNKAVNLSEDTGSALDRHLAELRAKAA